MSNKPASLSHQAPPSNEGPGLCREGAVVSWDEFGRQMRSRLNRAIEALLYFAVVFTPWAFGTTQDWSISILKITGYLLGGLLLLLRFFPPSGPESQQRRPGGRALAGVTVLVLGYVLISVLNARATYDRHLFTFVYHDYIPWLPHSYESVSTWFAFWLYLALACIFWTVRVWIGGQGQEGGGLPPRLRRFLWVLSINGAVLALVCLIQRASGTNKLLWIVEPTVNKTTASFFGPYAYRSNAAAYLNLLWPVCLALWWGSTRNGREEKRRRAGSEVSRAGLHKMLLPMALLMAGAAIASLSRAGAIIAVAQLVAVGLIFSRAWRQRGEPVAWAAVALAAAIVAIAGAYDWSTLKQRLQTTVVERVTGREEIFATAKRMAADFKVLGSGAETFPQIYGFYLSNATQYWAAQVHNDWLETFITFGAVGMSFILLGLALVFASYFIGGGFPVPWPVVALLCVGLAGCLLHAILDFPFQIASILLLFLVLCAVLSCLSRPSSTGSPDF